MKYKIGDKFKAPSVNELDALGLYIDDRDGMIRKKNVYGKESKERVIIRSELLGRVINIRNIIHDSEYPYKCEMHPYEFRNSAGDFNQEELERYFVKIGETKIETENKKKSSFIRIGDHFFRKKDVLRLTCEEVNYRSSEHKWILYVMTEDRSLYEVKASESKEELKAVIEEIVSKFEW